MPYSRSLLAGSALFLLDPALAARTAAETSSPVVTITAEELERLPSGRNIGDILKALPCSPQAVPTFTRPQSPAPNAPGSLSCIRPADIRMVEIYRIHNSTRAQFGSQPLVWDPALAAAAQSYAGQLARTGQLVHAPRDGRGNSRENLSKGLLSWSSRQMLGNWLNEQRLFRPGIYPNVSTTGRWDDVSHFTQIVWPKTVKLGCGMADGSGYRWLVCRYSPGGNKDGVAIAPAAQPPGRRVSQALCNGPQGPMMCPEPEPEGAPQAGHGDQPAGGANDGGGGQDDGGTRVRPPAPTAAPPEEGISRITGDCGASVIAKVRISERVPLDPDKPLKKESHNLSHGFSEVVIPYNWDASIDFRPDPDPQKTFKAPGTMDAKWEIVGQPNPHTANITGGYPKLRRGKWDRRNGFTDIDPPVRPTVQQHRIHAIWDPQPPTDPDKCETGHEFTVTFAGLIPNPDSFDTEAFVGDARGAGFAGTRARNPAREGSRGFHESRPKAYFRNGNVVVPIGTYWDLPDDCCDIKNASRKVIQFARAAIHGPNGRQGKGWALDILPSELERAKGRNPTHNPTYTGQPRDDGDQVPTPGGAGGTSSFGSDVVQWDAPGMPKDLYDRLFAAQGASIYRQQFLSLLVCRPPGTTTVRKNLQSGKICRIAVTTVRWDFPGQRGVEAQPARRRGDPPVMPYRQPRISISFNERDGNCMDLSAFLAANGLLAPFERPSSDARNLEIMDEAPFQELDGSVTDWETNPFAGLRFP